MKSFITLLFALSFFQGAVFAGNKVHFSVDAQKEVSNDTVIVQMVAQHQADTPSLVSKHIIETHIQRSNFMQRPQVRMATMALDTAPIVEEGKQVITVSVSGVVELFDE